MSPTATNPLECSQCRSLLDLYAERTGAYEIAVTSYRGAIIAGADREIVLAQKRATECANAVREARRDYQSHLLISHPVRVN